MHYCCLLMRVVQQQYECRCCWIKRPIHGDSECWGGNSWGIESSDSKHYTRRGQNGESIQHLSTSGLFGAVDGPTAQLYDDGIVLCTASAYLRTPRIQCLRNTLDAVPYLALDRKELLMHYSNERYNY